MFQDINVNCFVLLRVFPSELSSEGSMEQKRQSLRRIPDDPLKDFADRAGVNVSLFIYEGKQ